MSRPTDKNRQTNGSDMDLRCVCVSIKSISVCIDANDAICSEISQDVE